MTHATLPPGTLDESLLPILVVTYPKDMTIEMLDALFANYLRLARERDQLAYVVDMRFLDLSLVGASGRRHAAELHARHRKELARSSVCEARVVSSPLMRGVLTAFDWIKGEGLWPCETFATREEAVAWINQKLAAKSKGASRSL
jgi:hypothetical protein